MTREEALKKHIGAINEICDRARVDPTHYEQEMTAKINEILADKDLIETPPVTQRKTH